MSDTPRLGLPLIAPEQALKHITHNEAVLALDALVQPVLLETGVIAPPADPEPGAAYGVGAGGSDAFEGHDGEIAVWTAGGWRFLVPTAGMIAWDAQAARHLVFAAGDWQVLGARRERLGINTDADATNRLAVRSEAVLLGAIPASESGTGDVRLALNRETDSDTASILFQSGYSGRAEIGLAGSGDFAFKVSADGVTFATALRFEASAGFATFDTLFGAAITEPAVEGGSVTAISGHIVPVPAAGTSEVVTTITGGFDGAVLIVSGRAGATLTLETGGGNLRLGADRTLGGEWDTLTLVRRDGHWRELAFSSNG